MIITKKYLPRRMFLKGMGVAVALPMLDAMTPALAAPADKMKPPLRLAFGYVPNGIEMKSWTPKGRGKDFEFTRILKPLEPFREDLLVLTGLAHRTGASKEAGDHARAGGTYLTGVHPKRTTGADIEVGVSVDQIAAQKLGSKTRLTSLELGCEATRMVGSCDAGYSCAYQNSLAWRTASTPMPPEINPRLVFERLYGSLESSLDPKVQAALNEDRQSVLDFVNERTRKLVSTLGPADQRKIDEYLYGSSLSDGNRHSHVDLPTIIVGRGNGVLKPGRHIVYEDQPPMTNLFLTLLDRLGAPAEKLGDSTGRVQHLSEI